MAASARRLALEKEESTGTEREVDSLRRRAAASERRAEEVDERLRDVQERLKGGEKLVEDLRAAGASDAQKLKAAQADTARLQAEWAGLSVSRQ
jgi:predicted  nucleic acid-binding Zn-ribbon protein